MTNDEAIGQCPPTCPPPLIRSDESTTRLAVMRPNLVVAIIAADEAEDIPRAAQCAGAERKLRSCDQTLADLMRGGRHGDQDPRRF